MLTRVILVAAGILCLAISVSAQEDSLVITAPVGGEIFYTNRVSLVTIRWEGVEDTARVRLEWSIDGRNWNVISDSAIFLSFVWDITGLPLASTYRIRALLNRAPTSQDNVIYTGHGSPVHDAAWSPSGDRVVSTSIGPHIWDAEIGGSTPMEILISGPGEDRTVVWSADSTRIVVATDDNEAVVFDTRTNGIETSIPHPADVPKVQLAADSKLLLTMSDDDRARLFDLPASTARSTITPASIIEDVELSPDAAFVLVCTDEARINRTTGGLPLFFRGHTSGVLAGSWSPDSRMVCTIGGGASIRLWDPTNAQEAWNARDPNQGVRSVAFSPDGQFVAVGMSDSTVTIWDAENGELVTTVFGHTAAVRVLAWTPQSDVLASGSDDNSIKIYDMAERKVKANLLHFGNVTSLSWDKEGSRLLSTSEDETAVIWRVRPITLQADTSNLFSIADPPPAFVRFVADGGVMNLGDEKTVTISLEGAQDLDLSDIDSVKLSVSYNGAILHRLESSVGIESERDSADHIFFTFDPVELPLEDGPLMTVRFRATLGTDSTTALRITRIEQIGAGPGAAVDNRSDSILIKGLCRASGDARLYIPSGSLLDIRQMISNSDVSVEITLAESGETTLQLYDLIGRLVWEDRLSHDEQMQRSARRIIPDHLIGRIGLLVVVTPTSSKTILVGGSQ